MEISAKITGLEYTPFLCKELEHFDFDILDMSLLRRNATFILRVDGENEVAFSWWVSPKRTRSYPYARVYDSLGFSGRKVTVIPVMKDEGKKGDRDFLQWDTISLMSLLGVYVIISYYRDASVSSRYKNKITNQKFDFEHVKAEIKRLLTYQSDALHWNLSQVDRVAEIGRKALESYGEISRKLGVKMHSWKSAEQRIKKLQEGKKAFMKLSRKLAERAQRRESVTRQPKEHLTGIKATITIENYLGGHYYLTCDEVETHGKKVYLIEGKHTSEANIPSTSDIKDGLLKMILFTNLEDVSIGGVKYRHVPILKLTTEKGFRIESLNKKERETLTKLRKEAETNGFKVLANGKFLARTRAFHRLRAKKQHGKIRLNR